MIRGCCLKGTKAGGGAGGGCLRAAAARGLGETEQVMSGADFSPIFIDDPFPCPDNALYGISALVFALLRRRGLHEKSHVPSLQNLRKEVIAMPAKKKAKKAVKKSKKK